MFQRGMDSQALREKLGMVATYSARAYEDNAVITLEVRK